MVEQDKLGGMEVTSRERVRATLNHQEPDKLAIDFGAHRSSGISAIAYNHLKEYLGYRPETTKLYDLMQQLAIPEPFILERFGGDIVQVQRIAPAYGVKIDRWKMGELPDGSPCQVPYDFNPVIDERGNYLIKDPKTGIAYGIRPPKSYYYDSARYYLKDVDTIEELDKVMELPEVTDEELDFLETQAIDLYYNTDKALQVHVGSAVFEQGQQDFGFENWYCYLLEEQELVHHWASKMTEAYLKCLDRILGRIGKYVDIVLFGGDDLGNQIQPQLSVPLYREMIKPYHKELYGFVRKNYPNVKVGLHSCGSIIDLLPDLIDAGLQVLNPVQISAVGMDPVKLKKEFGKDLVFWGGGADMQQFIAKTDSMDAIYEHVQRNIEIFAPGGGFIFNQCHNILADVPPEKVITIYQAALDYRSK